MINWSSYWGSTGRAIEESMRDKLNHDHATIFVDKVKFSTINTEILCATS